MASSVACNIPTLSAGLFSGASSPSMSKTSQVSSLKATSPLKPCRGRSSIMAPRASSPQVSDESLKVNDLSKAFAGDNDVVPNTFIDESMGVVCYETESGEIVCEGIDEGPNFYPPSVSNFYMPDTRAAAILPFFGEGMYEI